MPRKIANLYGNDVGGLTDVVDGLFAIARADGAVHEAELVYLERVAGIFGIDGPAFARIAERHVVGAEGDPYVVLGVERGRPFADNPAPIPEARRRIASRQTGGAGRAAGMPRARQSAPRRHQPRLRADRARVARLVMPPIEPAASPNFGQRAEGKPIDMLILHYTGMDKRRAAR